jgi:hypothetical protein
LSEHALCNWIFRTGEKGAPSTGVTGGRGRELSHISALVSNACDKGNEPGPTNNYLLEYSGGDSKSLNSFAIDPTVWSELLG